jgi:hypothetical protein
MNAPLTFKLRNGNIVLARLSHGEPYPFTFSNRTQAQNAALKAGGEVIQCGRPFFVRMPTQPTCDHFDMAYEDQCAAQCGPGL